MRRLLAIVALLGVLLGCVTAFGVLDRTAFEVEGDRLYMSGEIATSSPRRFFAVMADNPQVQTIVLMDMPGSVDEIAVHDMGYFIRENGLDTHLTPQSEIFSGAVDLFLSGNSRTMTCCATIGVHDWADAFGEGSDYPPDAPEHDANVAYFETMLGSDAFYWFTLQAAGSDEMHIMTEAELARFGMLTAPIRN